MGMKSGTRRLTGAYRKFHPLQDVCLWVEGHDLLMQYEPKTPDDRLFCH